MYVDTVSSSSTLCACMHVVVISHQVPHHQTRRAIKLKKSDEGVELAMHELEVCGMQMLVAFLV